jgi:Flp pilus assembly protein TadG
MMHRDREPGVTNGSRKWVRRAATAVEFAVVAPVLLFVLFNIIEYGRQLMVMELLTDAARRGCRQAILEGTTTQQIKDAATNYLSGFGISGDSAQVIINDGAGNVTEAQNVPAYSELSVVVTVPTSDVSWMPSGLQIYIPGLGNLGIGASGTLQGQFTMRRE